jgi:L-ribulose-5-phosphate 4-epimerase
MQSGNASAVHRESGLVLIKPSGVDVSGLTPEMLVVTDLTGGVAEASRVPDGVVSALKPSVDLVHHLGLYRADEKIGGVVHTHSTYATAWAAANRAIPCALTAMADIFGGDIPCVPYCDNTGDNIVRAILAHRSRGPAVLLERHGVFAFGATVSAALKAAAMTEVAAQTLAVAESLGGVSPMPIAEIEKWWTRYHTSYGQ